MAFKRPTGTKLRQRNIIRRRVGLKPLGPRRTSIRTLKTTPKPKRVKYPPSPSRLLWNAAKFATKGIKRHFGR